MARDGSGQPAYDIFSIERTFFSILSFELLNSRSLQYEGLNFKNRAVTVDALINALMR